MTLFASADAGARRVTLVRLSGEISRQIAPIGRIEVDGEVHSSKRFGNRVYFTLKERAARLAVVVPARNVRQCRADDGERVRVTGKLAWDNQRAQLRMEAESVEPIGRGAVAEIVEQARAALAADGVLDRPRTPVPSLPRMVGVVCGHEAAVRKDIESVVADRFPGYPVVFRTCSVSGAAAADGIAATVSELDSWPEIEVIIIARGGGDATELLAFSDEGLCRAVARCRSAIVSAIGHEGDRPLLDEVADQRCGTPSIAAALVVPRETELRDEIEAWRALAHRRAKDRIEHAARALALADPQRALGQGFDVARLRLERAEARWQRHHPSGRVRELGARLAGQRRVLDALDPVRVLERGYAVVRDGEGKVVRAASELHTGAAFRVQLARGAVTAEVTEVEEAS